MVVAQAGVKVRPQKEREGVKIGKLIAFVLRNPVMPVNKMIRYQHLSTSMLDHQSSTQAPVPVTGKRRIWGSLKACSSQAVECAIHQLTTICEDKIQVKCKYKKDRNNRLHWWHDLSGEESDLQQLESKWEKVKLQTS